jgi:metallo-beta-lactamase family protein
MFEVGDKKILVDCGLLQGLPSADNINAEPFDYDVSTIDFLFITHAHIDHIGKIPKLVKDGFKGVIYSTPETKSISEFMLADMAHINESNTRGTNKEPLYTAADALKSLTMWQGLNYHEPKDFGDFKLELFDAGHILGSTMYKFIFPSGKSIMFSGDIGNSPSPLLRDTETVTDLSYLLMESVYGDRNHEPKDERDAKFKRILEEAIAREGTVLIPVFSLERTQTILYEINELVESKQIKSIPVFLDSPLAIHLTEIYEHISKNYNDKVRAEIKGGDDVFKFPKLKETAQIRDSQEIMQVTGAKVILAGSGMSTAGRILIHEEEYLPDPNTTLLIAGYQAPGTLGRMLFEGAKTVMIKDKKVEVNCKVESIDGYSAHADSNALVHFVSSTAQSLKNVFVVMGEPKSSMFLAQRLNDELGVKAILPERGKRYELDL